MGDHEVSDIDVDGLLPPGTFRYDAHHHWDRAWREHFGRSRYSVPRGLVGLITLDPFVRTTTGIGARIPGWPFDWMAERIGEMRSHDAAANAIAQAVNDTFGSNADANEPSDPAPGSNNGSNNGSSTTDAPAPSDDPPRAAGR